MTTYKVTQVAERLNVTPSAVYRWIRAGEIACVRRGTNFTRITEAQLQEFLDKATVPATRSKR